MDNVKSGVFRIGGMSCLNCRDRIEGALKKTAGVEDAVVNFSAATAMVTYNPALVGPGGIRAVIEGLGYRAPEGGGAAESAGTLGIILGLYLLLRALGAGAFASAFPLAEAGMGYGMLFVIGLISSVHCAAMCGGINLSQCMPAPALPAASPELSPALLPAKAGPGGALPAGRGRRTPLSPALLYNAGRVVSYTALGAAAGALGSVVSLSGRFQALIQLAAGLFMAIMGLNMLGIFPVLRRFSLHLPRIFSLPRIFGRKTGEQKNGGGNPLFVGLLNGFMPCGPLQAVQLYALSTGNPLAGGFSMFLFSMGTVPLMFGIGALGSVLGNTAGGFRRAVNRGGGILITVMGISMFGYGFTLSGFTFDAAARPFSAGGDVPAPEYTPPVENGVQIVSSALGGGRYPAITVRRGIPVKWTINADQGSINGCNNRMIIREYGIEHRFKPGENIIEFTPARAGTFPYSCWMGMIRSSITVVEEGQSPAGGAEPGAVPAGAAISTDGVALAEIREGVQTVRIRLLDEGIEPAILVLQRGIPADWIIVNDSPDPGNGRLIFPAYYRRRDMERGDNLIRLIPDRDFDFSTADNVFYGYVKVVDDLGHVDIEGVKAEAAERETLIYPDSYFEARGASCCGRGG